MMMIMKWMTTEMHWFDKNKLINCDIGVYANSNSIVQRWLHSPLSIRSIHPPTANRIKIGLVLVIRKALHNTTQIAHSVSNIASLAMTMMMMHSCRLLRLSAHYWSSATRLTVRTGGCECNYYFRCNNHTTMRFTSSFFSWESNRLDGLIILDTPLGV